MPSRVVTLPKRTTQDALRDQLVAQVRASGGDPSLLLELIASLIESRDWERNGLSFNAFITTHYEQGGCGWSLDNLRGVLRLHHRFEDNNHEIAARMTKMRQEVERLLAIPAKKPGRPSKPLENKGSDTTFLKRGRDYNLQRLQRDRPDLAERVLMGQISANEAAIEAGFRKKAVQVYPDDITRTVAALQKHFNQADLERIMVALAKTL